MRLNAHSLFAMLVLLTIGRMARASEVLVSLHERVAIEELARQVQDPKSARFEKFFSPDEIRALSAPSDRDYAALLQSFVKRGLTVTSESKTHLWVTLSGDDAEVSKVFESQLYDFLPSMAVVKSVVGLRPGVPARSFLDVAPVKTKTSISPSTLKTAYRFNGVYSTGVTGANQHIAIATFGAIKVADVQAFYAASNLKPTPLIDQVEFNGTPDYNEDWARESEMDAEFAGLIAPGAQVHVYASSVNNEVNEAKMFTAILDDNRSRVVSYSWGRCESEVDTEHVEEMHRIFARAIAQGVNVLVASGDSGANCGGTSLQPVWPATDPLVVAVGGTHLATPDTATAIPFGSALDGGLGESAWSPAKPGACASGGGVSASQAAPAWQKDLYGKWPMRAYPDISFNADPLSGEPMLFGTRWIVVGGTSMATPQWAGLLTLLNEARAHRKRAPLRFLSPLLYNLKPAVRTRAFNDVIVGNNGGYETRVGWDPVTGWGSPRADAFIELFSGL